MKNKLILGTLFLTVTGFITRIIGFFYRIFLSNALGARLLGIYQLIFPVYGVCFTLFASGIQTAVSKQVAEREAIGDTGGTHHILGTGILISVISALVTAVLVFFGAPFIADTFLKEPECAKSLSLLALSFPFCGITSCIHGYCYGLKKSFLPATSQLVEQSMRVVFLYTVSVSIPVTCELAIAALVAGELASCLYCITGNFLLQKKKKTEKTTGKKESNITLKLLSMSLPLTTNRLFINILHSFEAFLVPLALRRFGLSRDGALSIFGILSGMTMSFLMFPGTLTNSLSVLLLPVISESAARDNTRTLSRSTASAVKYSVLLGVCAGFTFFFFGEELGITVFSEERAGSYLKNLSFLCPFLYVSTTFSSILNGLGKMNLTFLSSVLGLSLRALLFATLIPRLGIYGYFVSLLASQLFLTLFELIMVRKSIHFPFDAVNTLLKPSLLLLACASFFRKLYEFLTVQTEMSHLLLLALCGILLALSTLGLFLVTGVCKRGELTGTK
ncbi:MAG: polysaccharide biosynthesis protein [Lachnospiraceae bacterium]|nr:polysaccharide biosynthesis protein [Lachnospiraceae bacterium]